jgi:hypothetical protein
LPSPEIAAFVSHTREQIEERVLQELEQSFGEGFAGLRNVPAGMRRLAGRVGDSATSRPPSLPPGSRERPRERPGRRRALSAEIARLRALRDSGALTEEQYARAVDRLIESGAPVDPDEPAATPEPDRQAGSVEADDSR